MLPAAMNTKTRAKRMSANERRQSILDAVIPLLVEKGAAITTSEIAEAAGIAEGTIFRVFPDKRALLHAAIETILDPLPIQTAIASIDEDLPIAIQMAEAAAALAERFDQMTALMGVLRSIPHEERANGDTHRYARESMNAILSSVTSIMARHKDRLAIEPDRAAIFLRGLIFTNAHPLLGADVRLATNQIVEILLTGILRKEGD
jgi:AcrR family transcriptional regulator